MPKLFITLQTRCSELATIEAKNDELLIGVEIKSVSDDLSELMSDDDIDEKSNFSSSLRMSTRPRKFRCNVCSRKFEARCHLTTHMRTHTGEKPYVCYVCGKRSARLYDLKTHIITHSGKKRYPCNECPSSFNHKNDFVRHYKLNHQTAESEGSTESKIRTCDICQETFPDKKSLTIHKIVHEAQKSFPCDVCGKEFMRHYDLKVHMRIHTGEKPYFCTICGASFRQHSNYCRHLRLRHGHEE